MRFLVRPNQNLLQMRRCMCGFWSGRTRICSKCVGACAVFWSAMNRVLAAAAPLLGVTGLPESNLGQIFRGPGVVVTWCSMPASPPTLSRRPQHLWAQVLTSVLGQHRLHRVRTGDHLDA